MNARFQALPGAIVGRIPLAGARGGTRDHAEGPMRLYYTPGACSQAVHIALRESGAPFETERVDLKTKRTERGADYRKVNPKGYVPALKLDDGQILTEVSALLQYVGDIRPEKGLAPPAGTFERYRLAEWLGFVSTELHTQFWPFFRGGTLEERKQQAKLIGLRFDFVNESLGDGRYLLGDTFTVADCYLFVMTRWAKMNEMDLVRWPRLAAWAARVGARPAVIRVLEDEGMARETKVA